jgi:hypothetical protein
VRRAFATFGLRLPKEPPVVEAARHGNREAIAHVARERANVEEREFRERLARSRALAAELASLELRSSPEVPPGACIHCGPRCVCGRFRGIE